MALVTKEFKLDLAPGKLRPVVNASQGDIGRPFMARCYWDGSPWTATGYTANIRGRKPDGTVFDYSATVSGSSVTFETTEQMTIISGPVECELVFSQGGDVIASANFVLIVEESPYDPDALSESDIPGIADLIEETIGGDVRDEVQAELEAHPEWTTTVQDGAITKPKIAAAFLPEIENAYVTPEMFGAVGDGVVDDTQALRQAAETGMIVVIQRKYKITQKIQLLKGLCGFGEILLSGDGCFTVSVGTTVSDITIKTNNKFLDFVDSDITSSTNRNVHANVLFKDVDVICESVASTLFSIKSEIYGFFGMVFKGVHVLGVCEKCIDIFSDETVSTSWITQVSFIDCVFGRPKKVLTATKVDKLHFERCTSQYDSTIYQNDLLYEVTNCRLFSFVNCLDWDYPLNVKLYKFNNCYECVWLGNNRTVGNFDNTIPELYNIFSVLLLDVGYNPLIYNKANVLNTTLSTSDESFFSTPNNYGVTIMPIRSVASGASGAIGYRAVNSYSLPYGAYSYDFVVNGSGQIKLRVRVPDISSPLDENGYHTTKWSNWYTFTPDS